MPWEESGRTDGMRTCCSRLGLLSAALALGLSALPAAGQEGTEPGRSDTAEAGQATIVLVVGAEGTPEYGAQFASWAERWGAAAAAGGARLERVGPGAPWGLDVADKDRLRLLLGALEPAGNAPLWIVLLGHGTFDGTSAKFNLRGPDVSARELATWLEPVQRPTAIIVCAAASGPFLSRLSRPGRTVVTAARSGDEYSWSRFGAHFASAIGDESADLDKDGQVSLLEAFLVASAGVAEFYEDAARLASEHALIDDNGDGLGTPAAWFRGVRCTREAQDGRLADGVRAHQLHLVPSASERALPTELRRERDALELEVEALRREKGALGEDEYYAQLEVVLLRLARLYE